MKRKRERDRNRKVSSMTKDGVRRRKGLSGEEGIKGKREGQMGTEREQVSVRVKDLRGRLKLNASFLSSCSL